MSAGSKIEDDKQEYQYSMPFISPSGHELSFYETPDNQRLVVKHASGSHIEFKTDGSIFIKSIKDLHMHGSVLSDDSTSAGGTAKEADSTTQRFDTDLNIEIGGTLHISAKKLEVDISETTNIISGTDTTITSNNITEKAYENVSIEGTKSIYIDTKEYRERSVSHKTEDGTRETGGKGGINVMNVHGDFVIDNTDPLGSITIKTAGFLNLVCGQERVDVIGQYDQKTPTSTYGQGTYTTQVFVPKSPSPENKSKLGDYIFRSDGGASYTLASINGASTTAAGFGLNTNVMLGNLRTTVTAGDMIQDVFGSRTRTVGGNETIDITGVQRVTAALIYLN